MLAGYVSGLMPENSGSTPLQTNPGYSEVFSVLGWGAAGVGVVMLILIPLLRRLIRHDAPAAA
ncbi:dipeptide/tripeptide permease B [compost metagenome]